MIVPDTSDAHPDDLGPMANNQQIVDWLYKAIRSGSAAYEQVPPLVEKIAAHDLWMRRYAMHHQRVILMSPGEFLRFVHAKPPEGLDATPEQVRMFLKDPKILDLWDQLTVSKPGGNNNPSGVNQHTPEPETTGDPELEDIADNVSNVLSRPNKHGNGRQYAIRRLREDAPEIHAEVLAGIISPNAGMIKAGFRVPTIQVPLDPAKAGQRLARHFNPDQIAQLVRACYEALPADQPGADQPGDRIGHHFG